MSLKGGSRPRQRGSRYAPLPCPPRIAFGAVASTVIRARAAEAYLEGKAVTPDVMSEAGRIAAREAKPISDFRASADYRRELIAVLVRRALEGVA